MRNKIDAWLSPMFEPKDPVPMLAIEVSSYSVKLLEIVRSSSVMKVVSIGEEVLPWGLVSSSGVSDITAVSSAISVLLKKTRPKSRLLATAISDGMSSSKRITLPTTVSEREVEYLLLSEVATQVAASPDELAIDYKKIEETKQDMRFHVISCRKDSIDELSGLFDGSGLTPMVIDIDSHALFHVADRVSKLLSIPSHAPLCVVDCGASHSSLHIYKDREKIFSKEVSFGGYSLTQEIQVEFNMEYKEAEKAKVANKLPERYLDSLVPRFSEQFMVNIERCFDLYGESSSIQYVLMVGGSASTPMLQNQLQSHFDKKFYVVDPLKGFDLSGVTMGNIGFPSFSVATGLLLRGLNNND